jgi:hypothetical protein
LRDRTRLRKALAEDRRRWGQRLHAFLLDEGWPCSKARLLTPEGLRWAVALKLPEHARLQVDSLPRSRCSWKRSTPSCALRPR